MAIQATKATRKKLHLKIALIGPSGSGKTYSALRLAKGIGGKTLLINTEGDRGYIYADEFEYDIVDITAPFTSEKFVEAIEYGEKNGYENIIVDSASHEWMGRGGLLEVHDAMPGNSYTNWAKITPKHNRFLDAMLYCKAHLISNLRGKDQYVIEEKNGKQTPKKIGVGAEQRQGFEYECQLTFNIEQDSHIASVSKDNTHLFDGKYEVLTEAHGALLKQWSEQGVDPDAEAKKKGLAACHAKGAKVGMGHDDIKALAAEMYGCASLTELTLPQLRALYDAMPDAPQPKGEQNND